MLRDPGTGLSGPWHWPFEPAALPPQPRGSLQVCSLLQLLSSKCLSFWAPARLIPLQDRHHFQLALRIAKEFLGRLTAPPPLASCGARQVHWAIL